MEEEDGRPLLFSDQLMDRSSGEESTVIPIDCLFEITKFLTEKQIIALELVNKSFYEGIWTILYNRKQGKRFLGASLFISPQEYVQKLNRHPNPKKLFVSYKDSINQLFRNETEEQISSTIISEFIKKQRAPFHDKLKFFSKHADSMGISFGYWNLLSNSTRLTIRQHKNNKHVLRAVIILPFISFLGILLLMVGFILTQVSLGACIGLSISGAVLCLPGFFFYCGVCFKLGPRKFKDLMNEDSGMCC